MLTNTLEKPEVISKTKFKVTITLRRSSLIMHPLLKVEELASLLTVISGLTKGNVIVRNGYGSGTIHSVEITPIYVIIVIREFGSNQTDLSIMKRYRKMDLIEGRFLWKETWDTDFTIDRITILPCTRRR